VRQVVVDAKDDFHAGRPAGNFGPPVSLFNPALGRFHYHLCHLDDESFAVDTSPLIVYQAHLFMAHAADSYGEKIARVNVIEHTLSEVLGVALNWEVQLARFGIKPGAINFGNNPFVVVEVNNEAGIEGDASLRAALSYAHIVSSQGQNIPRSLSLSLIFIDVDCSIELSRRSFELSRCSLLYHG
jgi:hypothetical protein